VPRAAALQALATLREFAVSGDVGAVGALGLTLARPLQPADTPEEAYLEAASFDAFIADERLRTALARLYFGHRFSDDIDLFTSQPQAGRLGRDLRMHSWMPDSMSSRST
jgi:hypothetical protein